MKGSSGRPDFSAKPECPPVERMEAEQGVSGLTPEQSILIFQSSPVAIAISRLDDGRFVEVNNAFLELYGYGRHEVIGRTSGELGLWIEPKPWEEAIALIRERLRVRDLEISCRRKSGEICRLLVSAERIELAGEGFFLGTFFDITERKLAEDALRRSEANYRVLFENSLDAVFLTVPDGTVRAANRAACEMFGMSEEELIRRGRAGIIDPSDGRFASALEERARTGRFFGELSFIRGDGTRFPAETSSVILDNGLASFVILRDISERKRVEQDLRDSEERYRRLFEVETDAILLIDRETMNIVDANLAARYMYGYTLEEFRAMSVEDISAEPERSRRAILSNRLMITDRLHRRKDGALFPVEISGSFFEYGGRKVHVAAVRDISQRKRAEQELNDRQNTIKTMAMELSVAEERERRRIAEQLHDQIAPKIFLTKMKVHTLGERLPQDEYSPSIDAITALIDLAVDDIRSLTLQLRPPILSELGLEAALKWLAEEFNENYGLKAEVIADRKPKPLSYELRSAIFHIVRELLLNVAKHAGAKDVAISVCIEDRWIVVTVEDNGVGFDVADSSLISPRSGGFGIFSTRMKIEYLGGDLKIDSSPGHGTKVLIRAPLDFQPKEKE